MARDENMPFALGTTYFGGDTTVINQNTAPHLEGQEYWVEDDDISNGTVGSNGSRSGRKRTVRVVRNMNAAAALPKSICKLKTNGTAARQYVGQIDGPTTAPSQKGYPVDEFLGPTGCLQYDLCYVVIDGLATVTSDSAGDTNISIGSPVVPGAGTPGRVVDQDTAATGAALIDQINNAIGRAAMPVNAASTDLVVDVGATHR